MSEIERYDLPAKDDLRVKVGQVLATWANVMANPPAITPATERIWHAVLVRHGVTPRELADLAVEIVARQSWFPTPSALLALRTPGGHDPETAAERSWLQALELLPAGPGRLTRDDFAGDAAAVWTARRLGWRELQHRWRRSEDPERTRQSVRLEWVRTYRVALADGHAAEETEPDARRMLRAPEPPPRKLTPAQEQRAAVITAALKAGRVRDLSALLGMEKDANMQMWKIGGHNHSKGDMKGDGGHND